MEIIYLYKSIIGLTICFVLIKLLYPVIENFDSNNLDKMSSNVNKLTDKINDIDQQNKQHNILIKKYTDEYNKQITEIKEHQEKAKAAYIKSKKLENKK
tara:strand:+ start:1831 stop:2127 length:297 start_codon:yes stop_codon:yes gene_type:complete